MPMPARFPALSLPLSVIGGAAGFFGERAAFPAPLRLDSSEPALLSAAIGAAVFAIAGALLVPRPAPEEWMPERPSPARLVLVVLGAGLLVGALIGRLVAPDASLRGALLGLAVALPLVPACALLIAAARRASRARPASLVARAEVRAQLALVAATVGALSAMTLPVTVAATAGLTATPIEALPVTFAAGAIVLAVLLADLRTTRRITLIFKAFLDDDRAPRGDAPTLGRIDFGLGDEVTAQALPGTTYRGGGRTLALVVGSPALARAALRRTTLGGVLALALLELVGLTHGLARDLDGAASAQAEVCDAGVLRACRPAALLTERAGLPLAKAERLHRKACNGGDEESCLAVELIARRTLASR